MGINYTILKSSIIHSSIWSEDAPTCKVWITMLAMRNKDGEIYGSLGGVAHAAHLDVDTTKNAIDKFLSPDSDSASKEHEGRRLEVMPGGWKLLNHDRIQAEAAAASRSAQAAGAMRRKRYHEKRAKSLAIKGEAEYLAAVKAGADDMTLEAIVDKYLPKQVKAGNESAGKGGAKVSARVEGDGMPAL